MHDAGWGRSDLKLRAVCGYLAFFFFGVVICIEPCFFLDVVGRKSNCKIQLLSYDLSSHLILESTPIGLPGQCLDGETDARATLGRLRRWLLAVLLG